MPWRCRHSRYQYTRTYSYQLLGHHRLLRMLYCRYYSILIRWATLRPGPRQFLSITSKSNFHLKMGDSKWSISFTGTGRCSSIKGQGTYTRHGQWLHFAISFCSIPPSCLHLIFLRRHVPRLHVLADCIARGTAISIKLKATTWSRDSNTTGSAFGADSLAYGMRPKHNSLYQQPHSLSPADQSQRQLNHSLDRPNSN